MANNIENNPQKQIKNLEKRISELEELNSILIPSLIELGIKLQKWLNKIK